jgi:hypothetical protein
LSTPENQENALLVILSGPDRSHPHIPVERSVLDRLAQMLGVDRGSGFQIGDGAGHLDSLE